MFKTIEECDLRLVGHSVKADQIQYENDEGWFGYAKDQDLDFMPCSAARVSFGNEDKTGDDEAADIKLMNYLTKHKHMTPFEHQTASFLVEVPLFIRSQIHRHRTFAYNEISRRYTDENLEFWIPTTFRGQSKSNRQASTDEVITEIKRTLVDKAGKEKPIEAVVDAFTIYKNRMETNLKLYEDLVTNGVCREQARAVLPQSLLTKFFMTGNLRNWAHFLSLRLDEHSQYEVRVVAQKIRDELFKLWPNSMKAIMENM